MSSRPMSNLTPEQQAALAEARRILQSHFPGERLRIYVPKVLDTERERRRRQIQADLDAGLPVAEVARRAACSTRWVRIVRRMSAGR